MLAIKFTFTANRYHATQWGRHVNEGVLEWPPSPWRILRGIVATWRRTLPHIEPGRVAPVLEALASESPKYHLPPASEGHTRHYMPYNEGPRERKTLVIDSFVAIEPRAPVFAIWPSVELDKLQQADLDAILRNMPYLGRAESWVDAMLDSDPPEPNSYALEAGALPEDGWEIVRTLVPNSPLEDLEVETSDLRGNGRIDPEGAQWLPYLRKTDCFTAFRAERRQLTPHGKGATVVRFALAGKVLPLATDTLRWGELARKSTMSKYSSQNDGAISPRLSGKDASGKPLQGHQHAFYLPTDEDGDGRLDHLTIWAPTPGGLDEKELQSVVSVSMLHPGNGRDPLQLVYQARGREDDFVGVSPLFGESKKWRSLTPYVLPRHVKFRGGRDESSQKSMVDGPVDQVKREAALRWGEERRLVGMPVINGHREPIEPMGEGRSSGFRPIEFFRYRRGGSNGGGAFSFELEFEESVSGPIAMGFACHYGLGLFVPAW